MRFLAFLVFFLSFMVTPSSAIFAGSSSRVREMEDGNHHALSYYCTGATLALTSKAREQCRKFEARRRAEGLERTRRMMEEVIEQTRLRIEEVLPQKSAGEQPISQME
jgi:hypothetical protein